MVKFKKYWEKIGKPPLDTFVVDSWEPVISEPCWLGEYRLANDECWKLRERLIYLEGNLEVEFRQKDSASRWESAISLPPFAITPDHPFEYREADRFRQGYNKALEDMKRYLENR